MAEAVAEAVAVSLLAEWSLLTPEIHRWKPTAYNFVVTHYYAKRSLTTHDTSASQDMSWQRKFDQPSHDEEGGSVSQQNTEHLPRTAPNKSPDATSSSRQHYFQSQRDSIGTLGIQVVQVHQLVRVYLVVQVHQVVWVRQVYRQYRYRQLVWVYQVLNVHQVVWIRSVYRYTR